MILTLILIIALPLLAVIAARPAMVIGSQGGRLLGFLSILVLPAIAALLGLSRHVEHSKSTQFCLSCHVMHDYGKSLLIDDAVHIPAIHYQNGRVPKDSACYTCHTNYTMYGDFNSKLRGLRHVYVQYLGKIPKEIKLYTPYDNRECLHCHSGARSFEEAKTHQLEDGRMAKIRANQLSCLTAKCHDQIHDIGGLSTATFWKEP